MRITIKQCMRVLRKMQNDLVKIRRRKVKLDMSEVREIRQICEICQRTIMQNEINMCKEFIMSANNNNNENTVNQEIEMKMKQK